MEYLLPALISAIVSLAITRATIRTQHLKLVKEYQLTDKVDTLITSLLSQPEWKLRTFQAISDKVGGFEPNELRKSLVRAGAVRFYTIDSHTKEKKELWGLLARNCDS